jgi:hypothetical protein
VVVVVGGTVVAGEVALVVAEVPVPVLLELVEHPTKMRLAVSKGSAVRSAVEPDERRFDRFVLGNLTSGSIRARKRRTVTPIDDGRP